MRVLFALVPVVLTAVLSVSSAHAGLLPGIISPAGPTPVCDPVISQPFQNWQDDANYTLTPSGTFEDGATGWTLSGNARVVSGNESYYVHGAGESKSLYLPAWSSAVSPAQCFAPGDWKMRFFARNVNGVQGGLRVTVVVRSVLGSLLTILDGGSVPANGSWQPSPELQLTLSNLGGLIGTNAVAFKFTPANGSASQIDDDYLDPWLCD
jgi:hypothetical protein